MKDVKPIIAENLTALRKSKGLTQAELAERLDYSDKAISRWEHGDTLPDMNVLTELCDYYGVTLDYLVHKGDEQTKKQFKASGDLFNRIAVCALAVSIVWLLATIVYVYSNTINSANYWQVFIWAMPVSCAAVVRTGRSWLPKLASVITLSLLIWTFLTSVYLQFLLLNYNIWLLFIIGVPAELIIILWYSIKSAK
jgi:transcriptional regulator with XRE-family HTH domain